MVGLLVALSPGLIGSLGACALVMFANRRPAEAPITASIFRLTCVASGIGGITSVIAFAISLRAMDALQLHLFTETLSQVLLLLLALAAAIFIIVAVKYQKVALDRWYPESLVGPSILLLIVVLVSLTVFQAATMPIAAWDALNLWVAYGHDLITFDTSAAGLNGITRDTTGVFPWRHPRHPPTLYFLAAFNGFFLHKEPMLSGWLVSWSYGWICGLLVVYGFVAKISDNNLAGLIAGYLYCTFPLFENHAGLVGYADFWITLVTLASVAVAALALTHRHLYLTLFAVAFIFTPLVLKNTGLLYTTGLLMAYLTCITLQGGNQTARKALRIILVGAAACFSLMIILSILQESSFSDNRLSLFIKETLKISYAGYEMPLHFTPLSLIFENNVFSLFVKQSFSVAVLAFFFLLALIYSGSLESRNLISCGSNYIVLAVVFLSLGLGAPQFLYDYSASFGALSGDLGLSRFSMSVLAPSVLLIAYVAPSRTKSHSS